MGNKKGKLMIHMKHSYLTFFLFVVLLAVADKMPAQVTFRATAPATVVEGEQFRLRYILNEEGRDFRLPDISDFDVLFGPTISTSFSQQIVNGKSTSENSFSYTYILMAKKTGTFTLSPASVKVNGSEYKSNAVEIKVLPPDESSGSSPGGGGSRGEERSSGSGTASVSGEDAFIRAIVSKNSPYEQEGFTVTFRLYTLLNVVNFGKIQFPEFEGFMVEEIELPSNQQLQLERYNGRNYYTADLRKTLLFPQRSGQISIPRGSLEMVFSVSSGRRISTFFGTQEVMVDVKKELVTNPLSINVKPLPADKPLSYANAVGNFTLKSNISSTEVKANEAVTFTLEISGTGNLKLIRNPNVEFPNNFEVYDPTINNSFNVTTNGLTGVRKIEYMAIPRYDGSYTIPAVAFSYFDPGRNRYETQTIPEQKLQITKGDPGSGTANTFVNRQDVRVEQDIRFLKTGEPAYLSATKFFAGSLNYWLWHFIPLLMLILYYVINRKQARENANVALMRTRKANKTAIKRLKIASRYLKEQDKEHFYDEVLRAIWGYFSDKLSMPLARLSKNNIEEELLGKGISGQLAGKFMEIMDTCEFARYAPAESNAEMDRIYDDTMKAIGEMENGLRTVPKSKKMNLNSLIITLLLCCGAAMATGQVETPQAAGSGAATDAAAQAYREQDYKKSTALYEELIARGKAEDKVSAQLYYNLGNAYFRDHQSGKAILCYERALLLDPGDGDIRHNLRFAQNRTVDNINTASNLFLDNWFNGFKNIFSSNEWATVGVVLFILFLACICVYLFVRLLWARKSAFYAGIVLFFCIITVNICAFSQKKERIRRNYAIVMAAAATVNTSPDSNSNQLFELHEGTKVKIRNNDSNWFEIQIADGSVGWIQQRDVEVI